MPAKAPRPGATRRIEIDQELGEQLNSGFEITCEAEGKTVTVLMGDLDFHDDAAVHALFGCGAAVNLPSVVPDHVLFVTYYWIGLRRTFKDQRPLKKVLTKYGSPRKYQEAGFRPVALGAMADAFAEAMGVEDDIDDEDDAEAEAAGAVDPTPAARPSEPTGPPTPSSTDSTPGTSAGDPS